MAKDMFSNYIEDSTVHPNPAQQYSSEPNHPLAPASGDFLDGTEPSAKLSVRETLASQRASLLLRELTEQSLRAEFHNPTADALEVPTYLKGVLVMAATVGILFQAVAALFSLLSPF